MALQVELHRCTRMLFIHPVFCPHLKFSSNAFIFSFLCLTFVQLPPNILNPWNCFLHFCFLFSRLLHTLPPGKAKSVSGAIQAVVKETRPTSVNETLSHSITPWMPMFAETPVLRSIVMMWPIDQPAITALKPYLLFTVGRIVRRQDLVGRIMEEPRALTALMGYA